jgi:DNA helicase-2/ATP-dependent DNA helicase PcrA
LPAKTAPKPIILNEEQQAVVGFTGGPVSVYAGPGSGKSRCATLRFAKLVREGISPSDILALTFTRTASENLKKKVEEQTGPLDFTRTAGSMTFHGLGLRFAQEERDVFSFKLAEFPLATEPVANKISGESARRHEVDPRALRTATSLWKRGRVRPSQAVRDSENSRNSKQLSLALAYKAYDKKLRENGVMDFDSLLAEMVDILEKMPEVRNRWQYRYVICDESQDCCLTEWQLLNLVTERHRNIMCVGDPGQSIYQFRGSDSRLFLNMGDMFPGTQKLYLATNYRSTKQLVRFLKEIGPVPELSEKFTTPNEEGIHPEIVGFKSAAEEAAWVISQIKTGNNG